MGFFSKVKASKEKAKSAQPEEPKAPVKREPYIPRYAVRDALQCAPNTWKQDSYDAFRKAHQERFAREQAEMNHSNWSNPKLSTRLSMSRNSSALSVAMMDSSRPSSRRHSAHANPFASGSSSYTSMAGMASNDPPVPNIPAQYASQVSLAGPSTPRSLPRSASYQVPSQSFDGQLQPSPAARPALRHSYSGAPSTTSIMKKPATHNFGSTPMETPDETPAGSRAQTPTQVASEPAHTSSSASTTSESSGERIEMAPKHNSPHDSPHMTPVEVQKERVYPTDPRKLGKAPIITIEESAPPARKYFSHATKPTEAAPTSPQAPPQKKARFSLIRRSQQVVAAH
ncbi:hypothetical protein C1H76_3438 [Elsinoe australis]|uniref:Uncharacterized protein n=1 Tax=Elsinoe australis TaxID=40998 RepID=A0A4U7B020_9PEZI|nr:hypothetical protein C1H76_3438 [Elsinoe australis]